MMTNGGLVLEKVPRPYKKGERVSTLRSIFETIDDDQLVIVCFMSSHTGAGRGAFGDVRLVRHKPSEQAFVIKCQGKRKIVAKGLQVCAAI